MRQRRVIEVDQNCSFKLSFQTRRVQLEVNSAFGARSHVTRHLCYQQGSGHADLFDPGGCRAAVTENEVVLYNRS